MTFDLRLAMPAVAAWVTGSIVIASTENARWLALILWGAAAMLLLASFVIASDTRDRHRMTWILSTLAVSMAAAALVTSSIAWKSDTRAPDELMNDPGTHVVDAVLRIDTQAHRAQSSGFSDKDRIFLHTTMTQVDRGERHLNGTMPVLLFATAGENAKSNLEIGAYVRVRGNLRATSSAESSAFILYSTGPIALQKSAPPWLSWANQLRSTFSAAVLPLPGEGGSLLPGLSIGDVSSVSPSLDAAMKESSLARL